MSGTLGVYTEMSAGRLGVQVPTPVPEFPETLRKNRTRRQIKDYCAHMDGRSHPKCAGFRFWDSSCPPWELTLHVLMRFGTDDYGGDDDDDNDEGFSTGAECTTYTQCGDNLYIFPAATRRETADPCLSFFWLGIEG